MAALEDCSSDIGSEADPVLLDAPPMFVMWPCDEVLLTDLGGGGSFGWFVDPENDQDRSRFALGVLSDPSFRESGVSRETTCSGLLSPRLLSKGLGLPLTSNMGSRAATIEQWTGQSGPTLVSETFCDLQFAWRCWRIVYTHRLICVFLLSRCMMVGVLSVSEFALILTPSSHLIHLVIQ